MHVSATNACRLVRVLDDFVFLYRTFSPYTNLKKASVGGTMERTVLGFEAVAELEKAGIKPTF